MYKIFINDKPLVIHHKDIPIELKKGILIDSKEKKAIQKGIETLTQTNAKIVYLQSKSPVKTFEKFQEKFKIKKAAGGLVINNFNQFLAIKRLGKWDLPKGKAEKKESMPQTALREVEEECGIMDLKIKQFLDKTYHTYPNRYKNNEPTLKETHWFLMTSNFKGKLIPQLEEDITAVKWFNKKELPVFFENTYETLKDFFNTNEFKLRRLLK